MTWRQLRTTAAVAAAVALTACGSADEPVSSGRSTSTPPASAAPTAAVTSGATSAAASAAVSAAVSAAPRPSARPSPRPQQPSSAGTATAKPSTASAAAQELRHRVIVDLDVEWRPERELSEEEVRQQRARVRAAEDEVLRSLGRHGRLRRPLHETAQTALSVDDEGLAILHGHPRVAAVHEDRPEPAG